MDNIELLASEDQTMLTVNIKNRQPVDLIDFAQSMISLGAEYSDFIAESQNHLISDEIKLYIKEIRPGSIITELIALAPALMPFAEHANTVIDFTSHLKSCIDFLKGSGSRPENIDKHTLSRVSKFVEPVAKDHGSILQVDATNNTGNIVININSKQANDIQKKAAEEIDKINEPIVGLHKQVVLYWTQTRSDNKKGYKAVIESISNKEVKVLFGDNEIQHEMIHCEEQIYEKAYVVDVYVETVRDRPAVYKIMKFYEAIDLPE
jgi:hypothetical protein